MSNKPQLIVIQGPTASGKTALAIALAKHFQTVVFSADSRQFYKEISIGTAKPSMEEQDGIAHFFIDSHSITEPVSAKQYEREALALLEQEFEKYPVIVLVGGSGLFIDALVDGFDDLPKDEQIQKQWQVLLEQEGIETLQNELKQRDPEHFEKVDQQNPHRLIRALELIELTGKTIAEIRTGESKQRFFDSTFYTLSPPREWLYNRIDHRVHLMMEDGLEDEVESVLHLKDLQSMNTVGYKEFFDYFEGKQSLDRTIELIQRNSRRYAKRQLTWFRRRKENQWIETTDLEERLQVILKNH